MTNAGQLKNLLINIPDETPVVTPGSDHSYYHIDASVEQAEIDPKTRTMPNMWEYFDDDNKNKKSNKVIDVLVIK